jgi:hypothetical protein
VAARRPKYLDDDEQRFWATIAGRQMRFDERQIFVQKFTEQVARGALETFLATCAEPEPAAADDRARRPCLDARRARRLRHLAMLATLAPPWEKPSRRRRAVSPCDRRGKPDAPDQILARWTWRRRALFARRSTARRRRSTRTRSGSSARSPTRAATGTRRTRRLVTAALEMPVAVGAALVASADSYAAGRPAS